MASTETRSVNVSSSIPKEQIITALGKCYLLLLQVAAERGDERHKRVIPDKLKALNGNQSNE